MTFVVSMPLFVPPYYRPVGGGWARSPRKPKLIAKRRAANKAARKARAKNRR